MSANSGNSGVRNLRAMFENKASDQSTSPPSRGRSPNPSELSNSSRPVSKVRASFVAVEKPGENGGASILGLRRTSEVSRQRDENKENLMADSAPGEKVPGAVETAPMESMSKSEKSNHTQNGTSETGLGDILKGSAFDDSTWKATPEAATSEQAGASGQIEPKSAEAPAEPKDETGAAETIENTQATNGQKPGPPPTTQLQTTKTAQPVKPAPTRQINTKASPRSPITSKSSPKTPTSPVAHIRGGPAKIKGVMESAKRAQEARAVAKQNAEKENKAQPTALKTNTQSEPKQSSTAVKKEQAPASPKAVKSPKAVEPKSPAKPTKLPAAATAPTAASAARQETHKSPTEAEHRKPAAKRPSTVSTKPPRASTSSTTSMLAKKTSRASLANGHDRPKSRVSTGKPDEGFLARMMRPTTSSAQKVHDKVQVNSPPRARAHSATKPKEASKTKAPPKMHLQPPKDAREENKEDEDDHSVLPELAVTSPLHVVKEDPMASQTEREEAPPAPPEPVEAVDAGNTEA
ncbi:hypothetical protein LTR10_017965 [Elasticomyces elasticus]|uniref:Uncharacterized protein n=1 Tax=Exophiala sideris TaxID=1016849 RepID=A0ABR0J9R7_9EURO|nr:hypothetical protein LTR10_017965 [Elasticomyces elasticus]KAK5026060.1 hypothetical protein LTS07_007585 [Exophiala sideris]KAK5032315.1 hypothetical protein LTR13_007138 [Exophiala sideris]KAK5059470.1 hypothetical protein LTR69_006059 [Exophiala sideris]KAK5186633.1 hypothetical protein LTR44_000639 [Eurotiomycetes sp. CCFEE 6388]